MSTVYAHLWEVCTKYYIEGEARQDIAMIIRGLLEEVDRLERKLSKLYVKLAEEAGGSTISQDTHPAALDQMHMLSLAIRLYAQAEMGQETLGLYAACRDGNIAGAKRFIGDANLEVGLIGAWQSGHKETIDHMLALVNKK